MKRVIFLFLSFLFVMGFFLVKTMRMQGRQRNWISAPSPLSAKALRSSVRSGKSQKSWNWKRRMNPWLEKLIKYSWIKMETF